MRCILLLLLLLPISALADAGLPTAPYIYVEGRAEVEKKADMVTLRFDVSTLDPSQAVSNQKVQAQAGKVFALLKEDKIPDKDVIAGDLSSEAEYEEDESGSKRGKLLGYRVTRSFSVAVHDIAAFPALVDKIMALKVHEFSGITAGLADEKILQDEVWDKAIANARERAEKTLKTAGASIDSLYAISPVTFPQIVPGIFGDSHQWVTNKSAAPGGAKDFQPSEYRLAPVSVSQQVHVIYLIRQGK